MEMDPPPMHLVPSPFATQSGTCAILKGGGGNCMLCHSLAVQMFEPGMALNFDRRVMNFLLRLGGT